MSYLLDTNICVYWLKGNDYIERSAITVFVEKIKFDFYGWMHFQEGQRWSGDFLGNTLNSVTI